MIVAEYIADFISSKLGIQYIFGVVGGGAMYLNDAVARNKSLNFIHCHHEQAAAMAASGYARLLNKPGICMVTTGCGGTNAITGVIGAYQDNIPMIIISGQCKRKETIGYTHTKVRQLGVQEADIISIVKSITKYAIMITSPENIKFELEKAAHIAMEPPSGPVWLDVPLDIQSAKIDENNLTEFNPIKNITFDVASIMTFKNLFDTSKRPIIIAGQGIRLSGTIDLFRKFVEDNNIPVVFSQLGLDILPYEHPLNIGKIGTKGNRAANFAVQNADLILAIGSRLSVSSTGQEYDLFAREAKKIVVDINSDEHSKHTIKIDLFIHSDIKRFLEPINMLIFAQPDANWVKKCQEWKQKWPSYIEEYSKSEKINLYYFLEILSQKLKSDAVIVADAGSSMFATSQGIKLKGGQRLIFSGAQSEMGFALPASIGLSFATGGEVISIFGDGSLQMNIQELQTIVHYKLPIKIFVWNNDGYLSIRTTQSKFFNGRFFGTDSTCGVSFPNLEKIAYAYGIKFERAENSKVLPEVLDKVLSYNEPTICEVMCLRDQIIQPVVSSYQRPSGTLASRPLEDMYPFLPREEFFKEMIVKPVESSYE